MLVKIFSGAVPWDFLLHVELSLQTSLVRVSFCSSLVISDTVSSLLLAAACSRLVLMLIPTNYLIVIVTIPSIHRAIFLSLSPPSCL